MSIFYPFIHERKKNKEPLPLYIELYPHPPEKFPEEKEEENEEKRTTIIIEL